MRALTVALVLCLTTPALANDTIRNPAAGTPEEVVTKALEAALAGDFAAYVAMVHSEHKETARQRSQRERYEWTRFKRQAEWYVASRNPLAWELVRRAAEGEAYLKMFVKDQKHPDRMPVPVRMKKDPKAGNAYRIVVNSL